MTSWFCEFIVIEFGLQEDWCFCNAFWMLKMQLHYVTSTLCWVIWKQRIALLHSLLVSKMKSILCMHYHSHFLYAFSSTFCITVNSSRWNWEGFCAEGANKTHHLLLRVFALQKWSQICTQYELICFSCLTHRTNICLDWFGDRRYAAQTKWRGTRNVTTSWFCEFIVIQFGLQEDWCFCNAFWMLKMQLHRLCIQTLCNLPKALVNTRNVSTFLGRL